MVKDSGCVQLGAIAHIRGLLTREIFQYLFHRTKTVAMQMRIDGKIVHN